MLLRREVYPDGLPHFWLIDFSLLNLIKEVQATPLPSEHCLIIKETSFPWSLWWHKTLKTPTPKKTTKQRPRRPLRTPIYTVAWGLSPLTVRHPTQAQRTIRFPPLWTGASEPFKSLSEPEPRPCCSTVLSPSWSCAHPPVSRNVSFSVLLQISSLDDRNNILGLTLPTSFIFWGH